MIKKKYLLRAIPIAFSLIIALIIFYFIDWFNGYMNQTIDKIPSGDKKHWVSGRVTDNHTIPGMLWFFVSMAGYLIAFRMIYKSVSRWDEIIHKQYFLVVVITTLLFSILLYSFNAFIA